MAIILYDLLLRLVVLELHFRFNACKTRQINNM